MKKAIIGKKLGMTQIFLPDGRLVPVTVIQAGPCKVVQKKTIEKDGYEAVQFGFEEMNEEQSLNLCIGCSMIGSDLLLGGYSVETDGGDLPVSSVSYGILRLAQDDVIFTPGFPWRTWSR